MGISSLLWKNFEHGGVTLTWKLIVFVLLSTALTAFAGDSAYPDSVVATVSTGNSPRSVCCHPSGDYLYVAIGYGYVTVIRTSDYSLLTLIPMGEDPADLCILPAGDRIYVCDATEAMVRVIDTATNTVTDSISIPYSASRIVSMPDGSEVIVMHEGGHVSSIETSGNTLVGTWWAANSPGGICVLPGGDYLYVSDRSSADATCFSLPGFSRLRFFVGADTYDVCALPSEDRIYLCERDWQIISVISAPDNTLIQEIAGVGTSPGRLLPLPSGDWVYIADDEEDKVRVVRTSDNTVIDTISVGGQPAGMCSNPDGSMVAIANTASNNLTILERSTTGISEGVAPPASLTLSITPNPSNDLSTIEIGIPSEGHLTCSVYGIDGRLEKLLFNGILTAGQHELPLGGLRTGIHFIVADTGDFRRTVSLVIVN